MTTIEEDKLEMRELKEENKIKVAKKVDENVKKLDTIEQRTNTNIICVIKLKKKK